MKATTASKEHSTTIIKELEAALNGGNAHASFDDAVKDVHHDLLGNSPPVYPIASGNW
jgi:hypothetical protein